jgi:hypothetical protein
LAIKRQKPAWSKKSFEPNFKYLPYRTDPERKWPLTKNGYPFEIQDFRKIIPTQAQEFENGLVKIGLNHEP